MTVLPSSPTADELLEELVKETLHIRYAWGNFGYLFMEDRHNFEVLNATAPDLFGWIQTLITDAVFMGIARLTDPAKFFKSENASLARLLEATNWQSTDPGKWTKYSAQLTSVAATCASCRAYRNKRLGHLDLAVAMNAAPVPAVTLKDLGTALDAIEQFLGAIYQELRPNKSQSFRFIDGDSHVKRLLDRLTNRASQKHQDAVSRIVRTDDGEGGALLQCAFCGETSRVFLMSEDIPEGRYLKAWHFDQCHGVIGTETVTVELVDGRGGTRSKTIDLASRS